MALPFEMPAVSAGYSLLTPTARAVGERAALAAARGLSALTGGEIVVTGRASPCVPAPIACAVRLHLELSALPGSAALEVEATLAAALLDRLAGGPGDPEPATSVTPLERAAVDLAVLAALDGLSAVDEVESALAPRLVRSGCDPISGLAVELSVQLGGRASRARMILPPASLRAFRATEEATLPGAQVAIALSLRSGAASLAPLEIAGLEAGDVVLLDPCAADRRWLLAPGGLRFEGVEREETLHIQEIRMPDSPSNYPVALEVELARVPMTLGDLLRLEPGAVLPLPIDRRGMVTLRLGDRSIARGQLVDVEGSVGVRIESLTEARP